MPIRWTVSAGLWIKTSTHLDQHAAFRGTVHIDTAGMFTIRVFTSCPVLVYLDGKWILEGPPRWSRSNPEFQEIAVSLHGGLHTIAIHAHSEGVSTRMMEAMPPFVACTLSSDSQDFPIEWHATHLTAYSSQAKRINPQFGWIDWCDTRALPIGWTGSTFDDSQWDMPEKVSTGVGNPYPSEIKFPTARWHLLKPINSGVLTENFGYDADDPAAQFFLRDLRAHHGPPQGVWRRYDLGRVRLGRPSIELDVPSGAVIEFAYSEALAHDRVSPWITLSGGPSCNIDRFISRGGIQTFTPITAKAGRYMEVHVLSDPKAIHFHSETFGERSYHGPTIGSFCSSDKRLESIWAIGVESYRACSEDTIIDNPTRERGQWIGDTVSVGLENVAATFSDLRLLKKALRQAADCARPDGLVAGLCPGTVGYLSTYACHWAHAVVRYYELTGDRHLLEELYPAAERSIQVFLNSLTDKGLAGDLGWAFIDWGYVVNSGPTDMGLNIIFAGALKSMIRWSTVLGRRPTQYEVGFASLSQTIRGYLDGEFKNPNPWPRIGLQRAVLAAREGFFSRDRMESCVQFIKRHYEKCFPNNPFAPHLADPSTAQSQLITPFFSHFALPVLWENGESEFALNQYRTCWGWAIDQGLTTWPEVFDLRWSHCHQWSGCPTWQLTRYVTGLFPRQDLGPSTMEFRPIPTRIDSVTATIPVPETDQVILATYKSDADSARWTFRSQQPWTIRHEASVTTVSPSDAYVWHLKLA